MAYATVNDITARLSRTLTADEITACNTMLDDAAVLIDAYNSNATAAAKQIVSCRIVIRALGDGSSDGIPYGATQGSMSGLGYSQSWTIGGDGATGELYISKTDKKLLGVGNRLGCHSPIEALVAGAEL